MSLGLIIPAYRPLARLRDLLAEIRERADWPILLVDDGSGGAYAALFEQAGQVPRVTIARHAANQGKGAALKTGMRALLARYPDLCGVVTADADGQHLPEDIVRIAAALGTHPQDLVLGTRTFGEGTPLRSRVGNGVSRVLYRALLGVAVADTQTGLRGIPRALIERSLTIRPNRYEFETEMLAVAARCGTRLIQVPVATVYEDNNAASHFRPLLDSVRIYAVMARCAVTRLVHPDQDTGRFVAGRKRGHPNGRRT